MRLQLTIQRHALPPTNILWTVRAQDPTSTSAHASATISHLLEDVNDIIHLESEEWGLEDYVVEVGGYECLHFQPIDSVLKEDDKVTIRALQTSDLRIRKLGGRHQISIDGRHLYDGVAFGRPYLRKTARPAFRIPPRKRRKLDLGHGQYIEDDSVIQALLPEHTESADTALQSSSGPSNLQLSSENPFQIVSRYHFEDADPNSEGGEDDSDFDSDFQSFSEEEGYEGELELSEELKALLEEDSLEPNVEVNGDENQESGAEAKELSVDATRQHKKRKRASGGISDDHGVTHADASNFANTNGSIAPPDKIRSSSTSTSDSGSDVDKALEIEEIQLRAIDDLNHLGENTHSSDTTSSGSLSSESQSESHSSADDTSASESMSSSSDLDFGSQSVSDSGSEMGSDSNMDKQSEARSGSDGVNKTTVDEPSNGRAKPNSAMEEEADHHARPVSVYSAPGKGLSRTHKNNQRQKKRKRLNDLKARGLLAPNAGFEELSTYEQTQLEASASCSSTEQNGPSNAFEIRKQDLIEREMPPESNQNPMSANSDLLSDKASHPSTPQNSALFAQSPAAANAEIYRETAKKRATLDIESSRRMVFGSLGLRTPKTPAAEQELREKLAKQGRTTSNDRTNYINIDKADPSQSSSEGVSDQTDTQAWKRKLILSAVECEGGSQILSAPSFPFVQRWQESQQNNKRKGEYEKLNHSGTVEHLPISTGNDEFDSNGEVIDEDSMLDGVELNGIIQSQLTQEAQELSGRQGAKGLTASNMPQVSDFDVLAALKVEDTVAGTLIAFKQLDMSKETNWQPEISAYRTAKIEEVLEDGTLRLILAERDRTPIPPLFDEKGGARIFDKFEMPVDGEGEDPDTGFRELSYGDLIEPKLVEGKSVEGKNAERSVAQTITHTFTNGSKPDKEISPMRHSAKSTDDSAGQLSAQVEVSTPRQKEISKLIKDAGFHSSLDSDLLEPTPKPTKLAISSDGSSPRTLPQSSEKNTSNQSMNLDGASADVDEGRLASPRFAGLDSSSFHDDTEVYDSSNNSDHEDLSTRIMESSHEMTTRSKKDIAYPRLSQLVINESSILTMNQNVPPVEVPNTTPIENNGPNDESNEFHEEFESTFEPEDSHFDSLKSTIPPSEDAAPESGPPSPTGSLLTNPIYSSSEEDLPSLGKLTFTARSRRVSPPSLKKITNSRQEKSESPGLPPSPEETSSAENHTGTQASSRFQPSQIPPGTQIVDLTFSSDPISPGGSDDDDDDGSTQRSSVRIKQSSSQAEPLESLPSRWKTRSRRLVRGNPERLRP